MSDHDSSAESITPPPAPPVTESPPYNGVATRTLGNPYSPESRVSQPLPILPAKKISQPGFGLTWDQAEHAVSNFKVKFTPFFPFVVLDPDVTAQEILAKKPLLFRAIMLVASNLTLAKQGEIRKSILAYVGQHVLVMEERDLGILQGLLVFIAWSVYSHVFMTYSLTCGHRGEHDFYFDHQKITYLTHLAMGYAHNLAITRPPPTMQQKMTVAVNPGMY
ncbi:putative fungal transcriptional regulatory protein [Daldinia childiae]|uniref:putative fungal transcriptional regulatory protein n=1 Tax=Daldinia childiae TaxID=326645 RepID=UPI0014474584|nr:putative fungal transcriptional regulatory protein [Daldinia childiae]KAF3058136.1 putative fungal transcriptional regulatory protein [Daldinia childiae]